ncbi:hypothetical protein [Klebsiella pneumoniae IS46]|uniref:Uncharacterized protein n=1 Tax=Klebsiella pneumoniae IS43 TaxID=1432552 RepID=W1DPW3_KLEPN|nr:hypothetical protein [Klebsiella pneumoniae IS43]CDL17639.1 hypothetical protein [Klebsiella pneumoniae IS46]CDL22273.1 hypothetical protein [Klebsiella pneumoniae IS53]CDL52509.1 hypothetical protein [Klebsiella pneumoniae ISC21]CDL63770.1 hypothetical protein [Klebsiella pneumoniae IS39]
MRFNVHAINRSHIGHTARNFFSFAGIVSHWVLQINKVFILLNCQ